MLGVLEAFGGELGRTDCLKMLFLLGQQVRSKRHYDFFPYHYGPFSHVAMQDKRRLMAQGYLRDTDGFVLANASGHLDRLNATDRASLVELVAVVGSLRGRELLRHVYLTHPDCCCRSRVAADVLSDGEWSLVSSQWNAEISPCLFTMGYEGMTIDAVLNCLIAHNVRSVVDVRRNALSMKYGFSKKALGRYLAACGLEYTHCPELGIPSALRDDLDSPESYKRLFAKYRESILPDAGASINRVLQAVDERGRVALLCFERGYQQCHRHIVAEAIVAAVTGLPLEHLSENGCVSAQRSQ